MAVSKEKSTQSRYTVWGRRSSGNVQKVLWCLAELELDYELRPAGGTHGGLQEPAYLAMNPNGRVPTLQDHETSLALWESNAIVRYLSSTHGQGGLWPLDPVQRARADMWMDWQQTTLAYAVVPLFQEYKQNLSAQTPSDMSSDLRDQTIAAFSVLDKHLAGSLHMVDDTFTMADIPVGIWAERYFKMLPDAPDLPNLRRWHRNLQNRPAFCANVPWPLDSNS